MENSEILEVSRDRILRLIEDSGKDDKEVERDLSLPKDAIYHWRKGNTASFRKFIFELARYFGVSVEYLRGETDDPTPPTVGGNYFIPPEVADDTVSFPVIGEVAAGYKRLGFESWTGDSLEIPRSYLRGHNPQDYFVLRVTGNSMYPDYRDGDHVLVLRQEALDYSGQIAVVLYDGADYKDNGTLKKVELVPNEWIKLSPLNLNEYSPVKFVGEDMLKCRIQGVAKMLIREID